MRADMPHRSPPVRKLRILVKKSRSRDWKADFFTGVQDLRNVTAAYPD